MAAFEVTFRNRSFLKTSVQNLSQTGYFTIIPSSRIAFFMNRFTQLTILLTFLSSMNKFNVSLAQFPSRNGQATPSEEILGQPTTDPKTIARCLAHSTQKFAKIRGVKILAPLIPILQTIHEGYPGKILNPNFFKINFYCIFRPFFEKLSKIL